MDSASSMRIRMTQLRNSPSVAKLREFRDALIRQLCTALSANFESPNIRAAMRLRVLWHRANQMANWFKWHFSDRISWILFISPEGASAVAVILIYSSFIYGLVNAAHCNVHRSPAPPIEKTLSAFAYSRAGAILARNCGVSRRNGENRCFRE
jgi:hypothetical protein